MANNPIQQGGWGGTPQVHPVCKHGNGIKIWYGASPQTPLGALLPNPKHLSKTHKLVFCLAEQPLVQAENGDLIDICETIFSAFNGGSPNEWSETRHIRSMSVGDVIVFESGAVFYCDRIGWIRL